jgi:hypothetical protein
MLFRADNIGKLIVELTASLNNHSSHPICDLSGNRTSPALGWFRAFYPT